MLLLLGAAFAQVRADRRARRQAGRRDGMGLRTRRAETPAQHPSGVTALLGMLDASQVPTAAPVVALTEPVPATVHLLGHADAPHQVSAVLDYDSSDPFAVNLSFTLASEDSEGPENLPASQVPEMGGDEPVHVSATFSRDLLAEVFVQRLAGEGAVRMRLNAGRVSVTVDTVDHGTVLVFLPWKQVMDFHARTMALVSPGDEARLLNLDLGLADLLTGHGASSTDER